MRLVKVRANQTNPTGKRYEVDFFTATILDWKHLLKPDKYKDIICSSLAFLSNHNRVHVHGLVIMVSHIHVLWQIVHPHSREQVQRDF